MNISLGQKHRIIVYIHINTAIEVPKLIDYIYNLPVYKRLACAPFPRQSRMVVMPRLFVIYEECLGVCLQIHRPRKTRIMFT